MIPKESECEKLPRSDIWAFEKQSYTELVVPEPGGSVLTQN